jgi:threonylcarbamoyladenosine tRNA methylthiotransferase MtaB
MPHASEPGAPTTAPRVSYFTLGCRLNQHDTAAIRASLSAAGWDEARAGESPDVIVVNTCTVTARADQEARQAVRRLAREHPRARLVVTGCWAQRAPAEAAALPGVALVAGTAERDRLAYLLSDRGALVAPRDEAARVAVAPTRSRRPFTPSAPVSFGRTRALLKVQDGCDSFCAYCVVPMVRGRSRSLPLAGAVDQARRLLDAGFHELVLTGADLGSYGKDLGEPALLPRLVEALLALGTGHRVRISSIEPNKVDPGLVAMIGAEPRLCRHLHLPLQSGSPAVLRAMRRPYAPEDYARLVEAVAARGTVAIGADVIVGHPGEDAAEFEETVRFLERLPLSYLHVFRFSPRPGTRAALHSERAAESEARERSARLRALGERMRLAFQRNLLGAVLPALPEGADPDPCRAMTDVYAPVLLARRPERRGIVDVRVEGITGGILTGSLRRPSAG